MKYIAQYSSPTDTRVAISDWLEYSTTIEAATLKEAKGKLHKKLQHLGTWLVHDLYPELP